MTCPICYSMYVENVWPWLVWFSVLLLVWVHWRRRPCWFGPEIAFCPTLPNCRELSLKLRFFHFSSCHISCRAISTPTSSRGKVVTGLLLLKYSPGLQAPAQKRKPQCVLRIGLYFLYFAFLLARFDWGLRRVQFPIWGVELMKQDTASVQE